jgi:hypothetical protein
MPAKIATFSTRDRNRAALNPTQHLKAPPSQESPVGGTNDAKETRVAGNFRASRSSAETTSYCSRSDTLRASKRQEMPDAVGSGILRARAGGKGTWIIFTIHSTPKIAINVAIGMSMVLT